jgi:hypothetical protein
VAYSADGITWTAAKCEAYFDGTDVVEVGENDWLKLAEISAIAYGNGTFVAGGSGDIGYSSDGIKWIKLETSISPFGGNYPVQAIAYGNGKFVAAGGSNVFNPSRIGKMWYSSDGITWAEGSSSSNIAASAIAYGDGTFIAVGNSTYSDSSGEARCSSDGINWTYLSSTENLRSCYIRGVAYGNGTFIAVGNQRDFFSKPAMDYSSDSGMNWAPVANCKLEREYLWAIAYGNGKFVTIADGIVVYSPDN